VRATIFFVCGVILLGTENGKGRCNNFPVYVIAIYPHCLWPFNDVRITLRINVEYELGESKASVGPKKSTEVAEREPRRRRPNGQGRFPVARVRAC
jgi:hypothetical protein